MIVTEGVRDKLRARSLVNSALRDLLTQRGFLEVETPVLEATCGGADARPFVTYHNALGRSYTLRIATCALAAVCMPYPELTGTLSAQMCGL